MTLIIHFSSAAAAAVVLACGLGGCAAMQGPPSADSADAAALKARVAERLAHDPALDPPIPLNVQARNRVVYLYGTVSSERQRELAASIAAQTQGVDKVLDLMFVAD
jgi:osmotically-inducible protein OsmY